jgi:hypothetical protein
MSEEFDELDEDLNELIEKFENCLFNDQSCFFEYWQTYRTGVANVEDFICKN